MANAMYLAGFDVKDVHMTDLISGRETLEDIQFIGAAIFPLILARLFISSILEKPS